MAADARIWRQEAAHDTIQLCDALSVISFVVKPDGSIQWLKPSHFLVVSSSKARVELAKLWYSIEVDRMVLVLVSQIHLHDIKLANATFYQ